MKKRYTRLLVILAIVLCLLLYWWALAPIVSRLFISEDCIFKGIGYYTEGEYLNFENGKDFQKMLQEFQVNNESSIVDFYYVNNYIEDNPIYGKMCDVYALDVRYSADKYNNLKDSISHHTTVYVYMGDFVSYAIPYESGHGEIVRVISFCDEESIVRYIMITEFDTTDDFDRVLSMHANLDWGKEN